jgi:hypothetical protein
MRVARQDPEAYLWNFPNVLMMDSVEATAPTNIHVLNNDKLELHGIRFLGSTLWTDFNLHGAAEAWFARRRAKRLMEDFVSIRNGGRRSTPEDSVALHEVSRAWFVGELERKFEGPTVVMTTHPHNPCNAMRSRA